MATIEQIRLLTIRGRTEGLDRVQAELAGISRAQYDVARAGDEAARVSDASARKQLSAAAGWSKLASEMQGSSRAAREYAQTLRLVAQAEDQGLASAQQAAQARMFAQTRLQTAVVRGPAVDQSAINAFLGIEKAATNSARASADAFDRELSRLDEITRQRTEQAGAAFRESLNRSFNIGGASAASQGATFSALDQQMRMAEEVEAARRAQAAVTAQQNMSDLYGIGGGAGSARASAAVFEAAARESEELERRVAALRAQIDPLTAAQNKLNAELVEYRALAASGAISAGELAAAETMVGQRMAAAEKHIGSAGNAVKLTSMQMTGLGYQINDVATMLAMGASPFMVISSQAGHVVQVLGDGPGGVRGSLSAMKIGLLGLVSPTTLIAGGFLAAAAGVAAYSAMTRDRLRPVKDLLSEQEMLLGKIGQRYDDLPEKVARYGRETTESLRVGLTMSADELRKQLDKSIQAFQAQVRDLPREQFLQGAGAEETFSVFDKYETLKEPLQAFFVAVKAGSGSFIQLDEAIKDTYAAAGNDAETKKAAQALRALISENVEAERKFKETTGAVKETEAALQRLYAVSSNFQSGAEQIRDLIPDTRTAREQLDDLFNGISAGAQTMSEALGLAHLYDQALAVIVQEEQALRQGRELDLRSVTARTVAEQALIAEERVRLDLSGENIEQSEKSARLAAASALIIAQANREAQETLRSSQQNNSMAGMEGYQAALAGIIYRYQEQIDAADGAADAVARLTQARNLDIQTLQIQTQRQLFGSQQDALAALRAEAAALGATDDERRRVLDAMRVEQVIRRAGINATGEQANAYRANAAALSDYEESIRRAGDAWGSVRQAGESAIDSLVDSLSSGDIEGALESIASDLTKTFMELGVKNPLKNLLGGNHPTISDLFANPQAPDLAMPGVSSVASMQVTAAVVNLEGMGLGSALGGAPLGQVERGGALGAVQKLATAANDNMARYRDAIAFIESRGSGDYSALGPITRTGDRAYGRYQVMGNNIPSWTREAFGRPMTAEQFLSNPRAQDTVFNQQFGKSIARYGNAQDAASVWFTGRPRATGGGASDILGTSGNEYVEKFNGALLKLDAASGKLAASATGFASDFASSTNNLASTMANSVGSFSPQFQDSLQQLLQAFGNAGMGGGDLIGKIASYMTVGVGGGMDPWAGLRLSGGGYTGFGGKYEPAGIVHRNEYVFSSEATDRIGVANLEAMHRSARGYADGGWVGGVSIPSHARSAPVAAPRVSLQIINNGAPIAAQGMQQTQDAEGNIDIKAVMGAEARAEMTTPGRKGHRQLAASFGLKQQVARR